MPANFGLLAGEFCEPASARIVLLPAPYDRTSTWIKGADKGPAAIIDASHHMELYDIETNFEVYKLGIHTSEPIGSDGSEADMVDAVRHEVSNCLADGKFVVLLGGEHTVSIGAIQAHLLRSPDLTVLQLDAHADLRDEYNGSKYNHACVMARVRQMCPIVQVGLRSMDSAESEVIDPARAFFAKDMQGHTAWIDQVMPQLSDSVYITIDLDVFDPSIMPSTGTPEPGGLGWYDVLSLLRRVASEKKVAGFDVVELCPNSLNRAPDFTAAKLIYKLLSYRFGTSRA